MERGLGLKYFGRYSLRRGEFGMGGERYLDLENWER